MAHDSDDLFNDLFDMDDEDHDVDRSDVQRAPYGYVGGKSESIPFLMKHLPHRYKWVDHFGGSGVVTINRPPSKLEVFNDRYSGVTCFYRCLQRKETMEALVARLELGCHSREEFLHSRDTWLVETDTVERAAKWFYMMRTSVISKGHCFARSTNSLAPITIPNALKLFLPVHLRFRDIIVENLDFEQCLKDFDSEDTVHYFDPPYFGTDAGIYNDAWTEDDLKRLLRAIGNAKGFCALSHYAHPLIEAQPYWTNKHTWQVNVTTRVISEVNTHVGNYSTYDTATECLYIKE